MAKGYKKVTERDFDLVKELQRSGFKQKKIMDITGRGSGTVWLMMAVDTYADYTTRRSQYVKASKEKASAKNITFTNQGHVMPIDATKPSVLVVPPEIRSTDPLTQIAEAIDANTEQLRLMHLAVLRVAMALENNTNKKGWLK